MTVVVVVDSNIAIRVENLRDEDVTRDLDLTAELHKRGIQTITVQRSMHLLKAGTGEAELNV